MCGTRGLGSHICVIKKVNKQVEKKLGILSWIRDQRTKKQGNKGTAESCETREVVYTCRYTSGHLIPTLQSITMTELGLDVH